ncbi:MAG: motility associated factor glycosyltransferase family protein [Desulfovibrio sp.]
MADYPYLKLNIEHLKAIGSPIYDWLTAQNFDAADLQDQLITNKWDMLDIKMENGTGIFDAITPDIAYDNWNDPDLADTSGTIIIGSNLGYGINHVLMSTPDSHKIVVMEPNPKILMACFGQSDYTPFMKSGKLHFALPDEEHIFSFIKNFDLQFIFGKIHLRGDIPSGQLGPEYAKWITSTKAQMENFSVELTTMRARQDTMVGNELGNFGRALKEGSLQTMKDKGQGLGAVILGAGPSLAEHAPKLKEYSEHMLFATALQTLPALQRLDIKPHICLAIDYDKTMLQIFDRMDMEAAKDIPLIYSTKVSPEVIKRYPGPTIAMWTIGGIGTFALQGQEFMVDAGGNVSLALMRFLRFCGISHMLLCGQDYSWKGEQTHSSGHHAANVKMEFVGDNYRKLKNLSGEEVMTSIQYLTAKRDLEKDLTKESVPTFNLYGGGLDIKGAPALDQTQAEAMGLMISEEGALDSFLTALMDSRKIKNTFSHDARSHLWTSSMRNVERQLEKLFKKPQNNQKEIHALLHQVTVFIKQDPLYIPYLYNEILDMNGLARAIRTYSRKELSEFKRLRKAILTKIRQIDRCVEAAAA